MEYTRSVWNDAFFVPLISFTKRPIDDLTNWLTVSGLVIQETGCQITCLHLAKNYLMSYLQSDDIEAEVIKLSFHIVSSLCILLTSC